MYVVYNASQMYVKSISMEWKCILMGSHFNYAINPNWISLLAPMFVFSVIFLDVS